MRYMRRGQLRSEVLHFSSHTFDPSLDPKQRTFEVGVLYDVTHPYEAAHAERLLFALKRAGIDARANEPYTGVGFAICTSFRKEFGARYAGIQLETSHAVTHATGGCARSIASSAPWAPILRPGLPRRRSGGASGRFSTACGA